jgi:hypothetical protein
MANVGIAVAAVAAITIASGGQAVAGCSTAVRPNITRHARLATVATERQLGHLAPVAAISCKCCRGSTPPLTFRLQAMQVVSSGAKASA